MWDSAWTPVTTPGAFQDPYLPWLGYAPFGIQAANGAIFVTYAKQPASPGPELHGRGLGVLDEYSPSGDHISSFFKEPWDQWLSDDQLRGSDGHRLTIDGLWEIAFGSGAANSPTTSLYFAAGPDGGTHGLFGTVSAHP